MAKGIQRKANQKGKSKLRLGAACVVKGVVYGAVFTVFAVLAFAFMIKTTNLESGVIPIINELIKMAGILIAVSAAVKGDLKPGLVKAGITGVCYTAAGFFIMSLIAGSLGQPMVLLSDGVTGAIAGVVFALLMGLFGGKKKKR
ncbi:MAG: DUF3792 family protein [Clostridiales bacterium]|nr:DUF3792 family protein [Clostridiales bacterium]